MPADNTELDQGFAALEAAVTRMETVGTSVVTALNNQAGQIIAALEADNAIDQANTNRATEIVRRVNTALTAQVDRLETAVNANTPNE